MTEEILQKLYQGGKTGQTLYFQSRRNDFPAPAEFFCAILLEKVFRFGKGFSIFSIYRVSPKHVECFP